MMTSSNLWAKYLCSRYLAINVMTVIENSKIAGSVSVIDATLLRDLSSMSIKIAQHKKCVCHDVTEHFFKCKKAKLTSKVITSSAGRGYEA